MYCPNCGSRNQFVNSYCRNCGGFLPDFEKLAENRITPQQHLTVNSVLGGMTAVVSAALAIALYWNFLGREDTHFLIYLTAGFLTAIFFWQVQVIWRNVILKRHLPERGAIPSVESEPKQMNPGDPDAFIPADRVRETNRELAGQPIRKSPQTK